MRVVHFSTSDRGGAGIAAVRLHLALLDEGVDSHLLTLYKFGPDIPSHQVYLNDNVYRWPVGWFIDFFIRALRKLGLYKSIHSRKTEKYLIGRAPDFENFSFPYGLKKLVMHPLVKSADVLHLHWVSEGMIDWNTFFSRCNKPVVWTLHDMNPFTGGCHHADDCFGFQDNCSLCPQLIGTIDPSISGEVLRSKVRAISGLKSSGLTITAPSRWLTQLSESSILFSRFHHTSIPNAVDASVFRFQVSKETRELYPWAHNKRFILFVAHHVNNTRKGIQMLLEAFQKINREDVVLCSVGYPSEELAKIPNLFQVGYITDDRVMAALYAMADVFVLPSMAENFPNTIAEALCCGTPCVAFNVGGIPEQINNSNGVLVIQRNALSLQVAISDVLDSNYNREKISEDARGKYARNIVANSFKAIYNQYMI
jgi:glycosyltransferase involved in cell wall biosynthesis